MHRNGKTRMCVEDPGTMWSGWSCYRHYLRLNTRIESRVSLFWELICLHKRRGRSYSLTDWWKYRRGKRGNLFAQEGAPCTGGATHNASVFGWHVVYPRSVDHVVSVYACIYESGSDMSDVTPSKSVEWLQLELESGGTSLLLLDCRSHELYESSHIETAINLAIPGLMLRRFKKGNIPIRTIIPNHEDKEKFIRRCKTDTVVLYDESTVDLLHCGAPASVLGLLLQKLWEDGCKAFYLEGKSLNCRIISSNDKK